MRSVYNFVIVVIKMITKFFISPCYAVLSGGETNITPSPLTNRKGTVRFVVCNQKKNKKSSKEKHLQNK
jgi:hypothetical protein